MRFFHIFICVVIVVTLAGGIALGQPLTGTKTIGVDYASLNAALLALNTNGVGSGGVIINVPAGWTETAPAGGDSLGSAVLNASTSALNPIVIQKSGGGANPIITAFTPGTSTTVDGIFKIRGTDYVTIDGIDLVENAANTTPTQKMEWGYALVKLQNVIPYDGCQNVIIKNCKVTLSRTNTASVGIYAANHISTATTALTAGYVASDANSSNSFYSNIIDSCYSGFSITGNTTTAVYDQNNSVGVGGGNTVTNFGGGTVNAFGVTGNNQNNMKVDSNSISGGNSTQTAGTIYGIFQQTGSSSTAEIINNTVTITFGGTASGFGIRTNMGTGGTSNTVTVSNNTVRNCNPTTTSGSFAGIHFGGGGFNAVILNNSIRNLSIPAAGTGNLHGMNVSSTATTTTISGNVVDTLSGGNSTTNAVHGYQVINSLLGATLMFVENTARQISGNTISAYGFRLTGQAGTFSHIGRNNFYNISTAGTLTTHFVNGVNTNTNSSASPGVVYVYNNLISDLRAPNAQSLPNATGYNGTNPPYSILGINATLGGTAAHTFSAFNNTVYLNASSSNATFGTCGIFANANLTTDLRNNNVVNLSTPGASAGATVAHARVQPTNSRPGLTKYSSLSNNNNFHVPAAARSYIFGDSLSIANGTADVTINAYKNRMDPRELQSISESAPFVNTGTTPYDLHINPAMATQLENGGTPITTPIAVSTDYDGNSRNTSFPDVGADEFSGISTDVTPPTIVYTAFNTVSPTAAHTLVATITDPSGVPTIGAGLPVLYHKVNSAGVYAGATATSLGGNQYSFSFTPVAATGDTVFYFVVAQDGAGTPNVGSVLYAGASGFTANPPVAATPPTSPYWYRIVATPLSGDYTVGASGSSYTTINNAIRDLNLRGVGGNVRFLLDTTSFAETVADTIRITSDSITTASKTVTIKPNTGIVATITGSFLQDGIFDIYNPYITIDGDNGSGGRHLTINNTNVGNNVSHTYVVGLVNGGGIYVPSNVTIKNCNLTGGTSAYGFNQTSGINLNGTLGGYNNIVIDNNVITKINHGILFSGASTAFANNGQITNNTIGSGTSALSCFLQGINVSFSDNLIISGNEIMGQAVGNPNGGTAPVGVNSGIVVKDNSTGTKIRKNKIHDFYVTGTGSLGAIGIVIDPGTSVNSGVTEISNNMIYNIKGDCNTEAVGTGALGAVTQGICVNSTGTAPVQIYSNTVYLSGAYLGTIASGRTFNGSSSCIGIRGGSVGAGTIDIRNNILRNSQTNIDGIPNLTDNQTMAVWVQAAGSTNAIFGPIDYNDYYVNGNAPQVGWLGGTFRQTLANWQAATAKDSNSVSGDPQLMSTTDLHVNTSAVTPSAAANVGSSATGVTSDYDGDTRTGTPDIGADEFVLASPAAFNQLTPLNSATAEPLSGTLTWDPLPSGASSFDIYMDVNPVPVTLLAGNITGTSTPYAGLNPGTQYYWRAVAKNADGSTAATSSPFSFTTVAPLFALAPPSIAFGNVVVATSELDSAWVHNPGTMVLTIDSVLSSDAQFVVSPAGPLSVAAGDSAKFYVTFTPAGVGSYSPSVVFYHSASTSPDTLAVSGSGIPVPVPEFTVNPTNHNFGSVIVGDSSSVVLRVKNVGTDTLNISSVISDSANFTLDFTSATIAIGDSADFTVEFKPTLVQPYAGNIVFTHDAAGSPDTVAVSGAGVPVPVDVTFRVDMRPKMLDGFFLPDSDYVEVRGSFNGWSAGDTLTDGNGDSIYTKTLTLQPATSYNYKFYKSPRGAYGWEDGISDRNVVTGTADTTLPAPYFNDEDYTVPVTFQVNMKVKMLEGTFRPDSSDEVYVRGEFNGWNPSVAMTDGDADSIYTLTLNLTSSTTWDYKFFKTLRGGIDWESIPNRSIAIPSNTPTTIPSDYFDMDSIANIPGFLVSPASIAFGSVVIGDTLRDTVWAYNTGLASLNVSLIASDNSLFEVTPSSGTIAQGDSLAVVVSFAPDSAQSESGLIIFTHDALSSTDTVSVNGTGYNLPPQYFLSLSPDSVFNEDPVKPGKSKKPVKRNKGLYPNWSNLLDEVNAQGGFAPVTSESDSAGGMVIGRSFMYSASPGTPLTPKWKAHKELADIFCWVRIAKWDFKKNIGKSYANIQKTLRDKTIGFHAGPVSGFDTTTDGKFKPLKKQLTTLSPKKQSNKLFAELVALKVNIAASAMGKTPAGFGDLIYDMNGSPFDEMSIIDISNESDSMMTMWMLHTQEELDSLYSTVYNINRAFLGALDTITFNVPDSLHPSGKLTLAGAVDVNTLSYLKMPSPFVATRIQAMNSEVESPEDWDDEEETDEEGSTPVAAKLYQNYPNPFNPSTVISFRLLETSQVTVRVYNMLGQEIATLLSGEEMDEGLQEVQFSADGLSSGVYFYRIDAQGQEDNSLRTIETRKMVLLK